MTKKTFFFIFLDIGSYYSVSWSYSYHDIEYNIINYPKFELFFENQEKVAALKTLSLNVFMRVIFTFYNVTSNAQSEKYLIT